MGESVVMRCDVTGYPIPLIFWTRDGKTVQNATKNGALTINQAQEQMTGIYTCVAQNEVGVDTYDLLLLVTSCKHQNIGVRYHLRGESNLYSLWASCTASKLKSSTWVNLPNHSTLLSYERNKLRRCILYNLKLLLIHGVAADYIRQRLKFPRTLAARAQQYTLTTQPITHRLWRRRW